MSCHTCFTAILIVWAVANLLLIAFCVSEHVKFKKRNLTPGPSPKERGGL